MSLRTCSTAVAALMLLAHPVAAQPSQPEETAASPSHPVVTRLAGADRIATSVATANEFMLPRTVVLVNADAWADAMVAAPFAKQEHAPILLTGKHSVDKRVLDYLKTHTPERIVLIGGHAVISPQVERQVASYAETVDRFAGASRVETAMNVADAFTTVDATVTVDPPATNGYQYVAASIPLAVNRDTPAPLLYRDPSGVATGATLRKATEQTVHYTVAATVPANNGEAADFSGGGEETVIAGPIESVLARTNQTAHQTAGYTVVVGANAIPDMLAAGAYLSAHSGTLAMVTPTQSTLDVASTRPVAIIGGTKVVSAALESNLGGSPTGTPVQSPPAPTPTATPSPTPTQKPSPATGNVTPDPNMPVEKGKASWYTDTRTASGERFNGAALTAAHRTLPFGTMVRVTNTRNGKTVDLKINDRGPYIRGRIIDVTRAGAEALDMVNAGVVPVTVEVLKRNS